MRQRKVKDLDKKLDRVRALQITEPKACKGRWGEVFGNENPICLEIGCGKGQFLLAQADENPDINYIGIEGQESVVLRALEKTFERYNLAVGSDDSNLKKSSLIPLRFIAGFVNELTDYFEEDELAGIYLNFSDPWPKSGHKKRRLTHIDRLKSYAKVIKTGGFIQFKTDNDGLFEFTLEEARQLINGINCHKLTAIWDLHGAENSFAKPEWLKFRTEYEEKFMAMGKPIHFLHMEL